MAYYALLDENKIVTQVISGRDETEVVDGITSWEEYYGAFHNQRCLRTSYNSYGNEHLNGGTPYRGNFAGIGYTYDEDLDVFIAPKPFPSWLLNEATYRWEAPFAYPEDGGVYVWNEGNQEWEALLNTIES